MKGRTTTWLAAFLFLALSTTANAHKLEQVRRELKEKGYDHIEFTRTKAPFAADVCRGSERLHLHIDWYGKITVTDDAPSGSCPSDDQDLVETESDPSQESGGVCKRFVPEVGATVSVACD